MAIKIYGPALSPNVARVLATLFEKEVTDYELLDFNLGNRDHKKPEYLALQPFGEVPLMVEGSLTLFESRAIARFLAHKFEGQGTLLYGSTPKDRALVEQWLEVEGQNFNPPISGIVYEKASKKAFQGLEPDELALSAHIEKLGKVLVIYEDHLTDNKYLVGGFFSLADLSHTPYLNSLVHFANEAELLEARPHVKAWWEDISARPTWKKVVSIMQHEMNAFFPEGK